MATLDFTELDKKPPGEALEALARLIGQRLGMVVQWSGRGADDPEVPPVGRYEFSAFAEGYLNKDDFELSSVV